MLLDDALTDADRASFVEVNRPKRCVRRRPSKVEHLQARAARSGVVSNEHQVELTPLLPHLRNQLVTEATKIFLNVGTVLDLDAQETMERYSVLDWSAGFQMRKSGRNSLPPVLSSCWTWLSRPSRETLKPDWRRMLSTKASPMRPFKALMSTAVVSSSKKRAQRGIPQINGFHPVERLR